MAVLTLVPRLIAAFSCEPQLYPRTTHRSGIDCDNIAHANLVCLSKTTNFQRQLSDLLFALFGLTVKTEQFQLVTLRRNPIVYLRNNGEL